ncbi:MAG: HAD-IC family P-type ATPase, partial [Candidatus Pacearchaeota archaeon]
MGDWHSKDKKEVLEELQTFEDGISNEEAASRLEKYGLNEIHELKKISPIAIFLQQFKSIFIIILLFAAVFSLLIRHYVDFAVISAIVLLNSIIGFSQQYKAEQIILKMKQILVPKAKVLRSGILTEISAELLVPGDVILVSEGDKIMADARILNANELETNEAVLTGESFPEEKISSTLSIDTILPERKNMLFTGTSVVKGGAKAVVVSTGMNTEFGKIAGLVQYIKTPKTPLEEKLDSFSKKLAFVIVGLAILTILIGFLRGEDKFQMILTGIALAVSVIPEGLPAVIVLTLAFAIGRMHKNNALVRTLPSAETLGRTTVICVDKTGTLTEEEMTIIKLYAGRSYIDISNNSFLINNGSIVPLENKSLSLLLRTGILCNNARLESLNSETKIMGDPTEKALIVSAAKAKLFKKDETEKEPRVKEYVFTSKRKLMSIVRKSGRRLISYVKGAPDIVLKNCTKEYIDGKVVSLTLKRKAELMEIYHEMASSSLRVLGFAFRYVPSKFNQETAESNLIFVGFQGMLDPPRKEVKQAIQEALGAGIKIKMFTGDSLLTAKAIAKQIELKGESIEGKELEKLSDLEFNDAVKEKVIFARITPELKLRIIQVLKKQQEIVAVTGDGINDVLALKEAHIGVAMGIRGADVSRESSDIILLDDNFASIVKAVREGRRVYDNMKKSIKFHLAANVDEIMVVLFALILAFPLPLLPLAILWMNLITDSLPSLALTVEPAEENIMQRKPRDPKEGILKGISTFILIAGIIAFIMTILIFALNYKTDLEKARTMALTVSVFCELFIVFSCRSREKNVWKIGFFSNK